MAVVRKFRRLLANDCLNEYSLGALLGEEVRPWEKEEAEERAILILQELRIVPSPDHLHFCLTPLVDQNGAPVLDANGDQELCENLCKVSRENGCNQLGFRYRCRGKQYDPVTNQLLANIGHEPVKICPFKGSLFDTPKVKFRKVLKLLLAIAKGTGFEECVEFLGGSRSTTAKYRKLMREALAVVGWHDMEKIGGPGDVVEVDEVLLVKRQSETGRIPVGNYWVFGGISRATNKRFAMRVAHRNAITLHAEIIDSINRDSIICSDGWAAYEGIMPSGNLPGLRDPQGNLLFRDHKTVIHSRNFVDPPRGRNPYWRNDILPECRDLQYTGRIRGPLQLGTRLPFRVHTQKVERQWRELRATVKSSRNLEEVDFYIGFWLYKENNLRVRGISTTTEKFEQICQDILRVYPSWDAKPIRANRPEARMYPNQAFVVPLCECEDCA